MEDQETHRRRSAALCLTCNVRKCSITFRFALSESLPLGGTCFSGKSAWFRRMQQSDSKNSDKGHLLRTLLISVESTACIAH